MKKTILIFLSIICLSFLVLTKASLAADEDKLFVRDPSAGVSSKCQLTGNCTLDEFVNFIIYRGMVLLPGLGAFALVMFVAGGIFWILSAGNQDRVEKGKKIMVGAIIGMAIVFAAWLIIKVLFDMLGVEDWARPAGM